MSDVKYDADELNQQAQEFIDKFRVKMKNIAEETLGELYCKIMPYMETDTWTNYREALRIELEHEYKYSNFKNDWATNLRRAIFVENREEVSKLIEQDILKRIKQLEDCKQEFEMFRYTPLGDTYQCLKKQNESLKAWAEEARKSLAAAEFYLESCGYGDDSRFEGEPEQEMLADFKRLLTRYPSGRTE